MRPAMTYQVASITRPIVATHEVCARVQPKSFSSGSMNALMAYKVPNAMFIITPPTTGSQRLGTVRDTRRVYTQTKTVTRRSRSQQRNHENTKTRNAKARRAPSSQSGNYGLGHRLLHKRFEALAKRIGIRRRALRPQDGNHLRARIDPEDGAGGAGPSVLAVGRDVDIRKSPAHAVARLHDGLRQAVDDHLFDRRRAQEADAVQLTLVQQHLAESQVVRHRRDETHRAFEEPRPFRERHRFDFYRCETA